MCQTARREIKWKRKALSCEFIAGLDVGRMQVAEWQRGEIRKMCLRAGHEEYVATDWTWTDVVKGWTWRMCGYRRNMDRCGEGLDVKNMWLQMEQNEGLTGRCDVNFGESGTYYYYYYYYYILRPHVQSLYPIFCDPMCSLCSPYSATPCAVSVPHILRPHVQSLYPISCDPMCSLCTPYSATPCAVSVPHILTLWLLTSPLGRNNSHHETQLYSGNHLRFPLC